MTLSIQAQDDNGTPPPPPADTSAPASGTGDDQTQGPTAQDATGPINFQTFYDSLSPYGSWIQTDQFGSVFQPNVNDPNWAPYTDGNWVYTNDDWTWNTDEPWGWATYHYGRWVNLQGTGWVWVPGYTWAPAWVSWRYGNGFVGWAPLPPDSLAGIDYFGDGYDADDGFHIGGDCDEFYGIGPALYIFLPVGCVCYHDYHHWYHDRNDNFALINHTTNVTNINVTNGVAAGGRAFRHVTAGGPEVAQIDAASENPVPRARLKRAAAPGAGGLSGDTLAVYAPHVSEAGADAHPARVAGQIGNLTINRGTDIANLPAVNSRLAPASATDAQIAAARDAFGHAPPNAKVLSDTASVQSALPGPITTLKPAGSPEVTTTERTYTATPAAVYNNPASRSVFGPVHMPSTTPSEGETPAERTAREAQPSPQRIYSPTPSYTPNYNPSGGGSPAESHTYTHVTPAPTYSPAPAPASRAPEPSGGGYNGGGRAAPSSSPAPSYAPSGGGSSGGGNGSRSH